jgi:polyhydroxyalkanoate synthase subunit PhaC
VVAQNDVCQIIQYKATTEKVLKRPLVIVPPWINKYYILDLNPQKSFIKWCVDQGHTVFVVSWVNPDERQAGKSFEHYAREGILETLDVVEDITGEREVNVIGYCVGGTLLAVTLALMAKSGDKRAATATFFTTQVDFTHAGDLKVFVDEAQIERVEKSMATKGYLEGARMANAFNLLRSRDLIWPYVVDNYMKGKAPLPFDLLYWNSDSTRMPAANHSFYLRSCYLENQLTKGRMEIAGQKLDLGDVTIPIYNLATREDHIAPARSAFLGSQYFGGKVTFVLTGSGHIAGVVNPPSMKKYQFWTGGKPVGELESWLQDAQEHAGSWWPHWHEWICSHDATMVPARKIGSKKRKPIEDAPGSYVMAKA